jgi:hypothetical protein
MLRLKETLTVNEIATLRRCLGGDEILYDHPSLYEKLIDFYCDEMPIEVQKARSGQDPETWLLERVQEDL